MRHTLSLEHHFCFFKLFVVYLNPFSFSRPDSRFRTNCLVLDPYRYMISSWQLQSVLNGYISCSTPQPRFGGNYSGCSKRVHSYFLTTISVFLGCSCKSSWPEYSGVRSPTSTCGFWFSPPGGNGLLKVPRKNPENMPRRTAPEEIPKECVYNAMHMIWFRTLSTLLLLYHVFFNRQTGDPSRVITGIFRVFFTVYICTIDSGKRESVS